MLKMKYYAGEDITDMKIYYDAETKQYKSKKICTVCGKFLYCWCYNTLGDAYLDFIDDIYCNRCALEEHLSDNNISKDDIKDYTGEWAGNIDTLSNEIVSEILLDMVETYEDDETNGKACEV